MPIPVIPVMAHPQTSIRYSPHHQLFVTSGNDGTAIDWWPCTRWLITKRYHSALVRYMQTSETPMFEIRIAKLNSLGILSLSL